MDFFFNYMDKLEGDDFKRLATCGCRYWDEKDQVWRPNLPYLSLDGRCKYCDTPSGVSSWDIQAFREEEALEDRWEREYEDRLIKRDYAMLLDYNGADWG